tara:strand:- start:1129 stop:1335 length:207 start_codon:yes stop_codon:yes gene_type:complete
MMTIEEIEEQYTIDEERGRNSLSWLLPISKNVMRHMTSEELYDFVIEIVARKKWKLEQKLLKMDFTEE